MRRAKQIRAHSKEPQGLPAGSSHEPCPAVHIAITLFTLPVYIPRPHPDAIRRTDFGLTVPRTSWGGARSSGDRLRELGSLEARRVGRETLTRNLFCITGGKWEDGTWVSVHGLDTIGEHHGRIHTSGISDRVAYNTCATCEHRANLSTASFAGGRARAST